MRIDSEQSQLAADRVHMASEAFGCGALPELQSAVYKVRLPQHLCRHIAERNSSLLCFSSAGDKIQRQCQQNHDGM